MVTSQEAFLSLTLRLNNCSQPASARGFINDTLKFNFVTLPSVLILSPRFQNTSNAVYGSRASLGRINRRISKQNTTGNLVIGGSYFCHRTSCPNEDIDHVPHLAGLTKAEVDALAGRQLAIETAPGISQAGGRTADNLNGMRGLDEMEFEWKLSVQNNTLTAVYRREKPMMVLSLSLRSQQRKSQFIDAFHH